MAILADRPCNCILESYRLIFPCLSYLTQISEKILNFFLNFFGNFNFELFAENGVHLGIFDISGIIRKILVLLKFNIEIFSVFNSIETSVLNIFSIQYY